MAHESHPASPQVVGYIDVDEGVVAGSRYVPAFEW